MIESYPEAINKSDFSLQLWSESYNPAIHDARIYTTIQRVRKLLGDATSIQTWLDGYRWSPNFSFKLVKDMKLKVSPQKSLQRNILKILENLSLDGKSWASRSDLIF